MFAMFWGLKLWADSVIYLLASEQRGPVVVRYFFKVRNTLPLLERKYKISDGKCMRLSNHCARKIQNQENNHNRIANITSNTIHKAHFNSALL